MMMMMITRTTTSRLIRGNNSRIISVALSTLSQADLQLRGDSSYGLPNEGKFHKLLRENEDVRDTVAYCLSFSNDESEFKRNFAELDDVMKEQLKISNMNNKTKRIMLNNNNMNSISITKTVTKIDDAPLPRTLNDALNFHKARAIVITETSKPFRVVNVNHTWENLCGYTYVESKGKTLGELLQGPATNVSAATGLIIKLLQGEQEAGTTLINYTKYGKPFHNRIRVGPLIDEKNGNVTHFVGVLQEIQQ